MPLCLGRDLTLEQLTMADIIGAVEYAVAAIEIVDSRVAGWDIKFADTIADNASSGLFVLGTVPRKLDCLRREALRHGARTARRGHLVRRGRGLPRSSAECHPVARAGRWRAVGRPLLAGDIVLSGALGPMVPARPGDVFDLRINGLGAVRAAFAAGGAA